MHRIEELLLERNCKVYFWDLRTRELPIADPEFHRNPQDNPNPLVKELTAIATEADAFVLGSPLYHNSYSGVLKNAIDHLTIHQFNGKPVGLVAHGAERTVVQASDHLRIVVRGILGVAIPTQILTIETDFAKQIRDGNFVITNDDVTQRMKAFSDQLVHFTTSLNPRFK